jgi:alkylation response protein AidB-like acyl-CoA dehydrogenase
MAKYLATEISNKVAYDMLQIHGGTGYMKDFNIERHYRDARITNIYEGTTQLQYVAAIGGVVTRVFEPELDKLEALYGEDFQKPYLKELRAKRELLSKAIEYVRAKEDHTYQSYFSDKLVDMATKLYTGYLFLKYAPYSEDKRKMMSIYFEKEMPQIEKNFSQVTSGKSRVIEEYVDLLKGSD